MVIDWHFSDNDLVEQRSEERIWKSFRTIAEAQIAELWKTGENLAHQDVSLTQILAGFPEPSKPV